MARLASVVTGFPVHRFTVDQYHKMIEAAILNEDDNVELIEGVIVPKMSKGKDHDAVIEALTAILLRLTPPGASVRCQCALTLADSEPEPDFAVCTPSKARRGEHPKGADTFVVVEVADTSVYGDRTVKGKLYAKARIPVYWIVNLEEGQVEVYAGPVTPKKANPHYRPRTDYRPGQDVPLVVAGATVGAVAVADVLP